MKKIVQAFAFAVLVGASLTGTVRAFSNTDFNVNDCEPWYDMIRSNKNIVPAIDLPSYVISPYDDGGGDSVKFQKLCEDYAPSDVKDILNGGGATPTPTPTPTPSPAPTSDVGCRLFLTFRAWYCGLTADDEGNLKKVGDRAGEVPLATFIWIIILNILSDLFSAIGYIAVGFIMYGGYMYILAKGDTNKVAKGKKILVAAVTGLIIAVLAPFITNTIVSIISEGLN